LSDKKISPEELNFHYNREERLKSLSPEAKKQLYSTEPKRKVFVNKRLLIVMVDILLIVIAFISVSAYRSNMGKVRNIQGCNLELSGFIYDDRALISLKVDVVDHEKIPERITVRFALEDDIQEITDIIPKGEGATRIVRVEYAMNGRKEGRIMADVTLGDAEKHLEKTLSGESD